MARYVLRRLLLALVTLVVLSMVVFYVASVLPGSVGKAILGPFADPQAVDQLNAELGFDQPVGQRYLTWASHAFRLDFGESYKYHAPVMDFLPTAFWASLKLAVLTLLIVAPLGIIGGAIAALRQGRATDRIITVSSLSLAVTPEFVVGIVLIMVFAVRLQWLPSGGTPEGSLWEQLQVMILPALTLSALLFGYLARMSRAGTIEVLAADYTRTATLKGLSRTTVLRRHVLRNALLPTIAVIATQMSYLLGGLLIVETLVQLQGPRLADRQGRQRPRHPDVDGGGVHRRCVLDADDAAGRFADGLVEPTHSPGDKDMTTAVPVPVPVPDPSRRPNVRREMRRQLVRSKSLIAGSLILLFWIICAAVPSVIATDDPTLQDPLSKWLRPLTDGHFLGTDRPGRDVYSRVIYGAREIMIIAPAATLLGTVIGVILGLSMGYLRGAVDDIFSRIIEALISLPVILVALLALTALEPGRATIIAIIGFLFAPLIARTVRAAVLAECNLDYIRAAELRGEGNFYIMFVEILPNVFGVIVVEFTVRLGYAVFTMAGLSFIGFGSQPGSPDWGRMIDDERDSLLSNVWWPSMFPAIALASLVVAINLVADAIQGVIDR